MILNPLDIISTTLKSPFYIKKYQSVACLSDHISNNQPFDKNY
jgi:hypothetical protein